MKRSLPLLAALLCLAHAAHADMIETKKDGILNGQVVSENEKELRFKDAKGAMHLYAKKDILFFEKEDPSKKGKEFARNAWDKIKAAPAAVKKTSDELTAKVVGAASQPLDRSGANAKSDQLARAMEEANRASAAATAKTMTFNKEVYRQKNEAQEAANASKGSSKGRFSSLD